jgi:hypothetical protein
MGFIRFVFIVIIVYYLFKLVARYIMPYLLSLFIKRAQDKMMGNVSSNSGAKSSKKEGEVSVKSKPQKSAKANKENIGDYVDFEDVEE